MADFAAFRDRLIASGHNLSDADEGGPFGSWFITLESAVPTQVIWDGKDGWLILRRGNDDTWIAKTEDEQTPDQLLLRLG